MNFEHNDRSRRASEWKLTSNLPARQVPTAEQYLANGGLYRPYELDPYFKNLPGSEVQRRQEQFRPKEWSGAPIGMLVRCFDLVMDTRFVLAQPEERDKSVELFNLYFVEQL